MVKNPKVDTYINKNQKKGLVIKSQKNTKSNIIPNELEKVFRKN